jgi:acyl-CoA thioesterase
MGDLHVDAHAVPVSEGRFTCELSRDWEIWGPNGGYLAAIVLDVAKQVSGRPRPANLSVHFLGVASFDSPLDITASIQRATRQASSVYVHMSQGGKPMVAGMVWAIDDDIETLHHDVTVGLSVASWESLLTVQERLAADGQELRRTYPFWDNLEVRPTNWVSNWNDRERLDPVAQEWVRHRYGVAHDRWDQAARLALLIDLGAWPAASRQHITGEFIAPSLDVSCEFHRLNTADEWLLMDAHAPFSGDGLVASSQRVWNDAGELLANGISHLLWRRIAPRP